MTRPPARPVPTVQVLLDTAIEHFGRLGLDGASTRAIAAAAGTPMSAITYHFGGKRELYLAAARHIAGRIGERIAPLLAEADTPTEALDADAAEAAVLALIDRFAQVFLDAESAAWSRFITREQSEPTEAFDILYGGVMGRVLERLVGLIVGLSGGVVPRNSAGPALALVGQPLAFRVARAALLRATGWSEVDAGAAESVRLVVRDHTAAILRHLRGGTHHE